MQSEFFAQGRGYCMIRRFSLFIVFTIICLVLISPAVAKENPYRNAGSVTAVDTPVTIESDTVMISNTSTVQFTGAGFTHTLGHVSITMKPLLSKTDGKATIKGNIRSYGMNPVVEYELYRYLIKERIILNSPETIRYSYDLQISDPVMRNSSESQLVKIPGKNNTYTRSYPPHKKGVTNYTRNSTIDIRPDPWGNLVIYINDENVIVMPKPFAIDATGKRFEMDFDLDKNNRVITISGDLSGARYPIVVDPTERITNTFFAEGSGGWTLWRSVSDVNCRVEYEENDGFTDGYISINEIDGIGRFSQDVDFTNVSTLNVNWYHNGYFWYEDESYIRIYIDDVLICDAVEDVDDWTDDSFDVSGFSGVHTLRFEARGGPDSYITAVMHSASAIALDVPSAPVANFTVSPTTGTPPLTVQFNDTSTNVPTSWNWSFGDGGTATIQNPSHTYTAAGTYDVGLTAANAGGSNTTVKTGYVVVTAVQTTYTVYADGVGIYHGWQGNNDLWRSNKTPVEFYNNLSGKQGNPYSSIHWVGIGNPVDDATGSRNWNINQDANTKANNADFAVHAGHGWNDGILFGTANSDYELFRTNNLSFGGNNGKAKWVAFFSCNVLNQSTRNNWASVFNGLHILMSFDTYGIEGANQGSQLAQRMTGDGIYPEPVKIRDAWKYTLKDTVIDESIKGAYMWAEPSGDDFLPGFGSFREPVKDGNSQYNLSWENFNCA